VFQAGDAGNECGTTDDATLQIPQFLGNTRCFHKRSECREDNDFKALTEDIVLLVVDELTKVKIGGK
jgi:hypothetical protein